MTEQEQRKVIAEWMGIPIGVQQTTPGGSMGYMLVAPNFTHDLNAMAEAIDRLPSDGSWRKFIWWLEHIKKLGHVEDGCRERDTYTEMALIQATAAQRAEALLRTIGKWHD